MLLEINGHLGNAVLPADGCYVFLKFFLYSLVVLDLVDVYCLEGSGDMPYRFLPGARAVLALNIHLCPFPLLWYGHLLNHYVLLLRVETLKPRPLFYFVDLFRYLQHKFSVLWFHSRRGRTRTFTLPGYPLARIIQALYL